MVSGSFHTPFGALCNFPSRYVVCYRSWVVFSLGGCFPPTSLATAKARYSALCTTSVTTRLRGYHTLFPGFPAEFGYRFQGRICSGEPHISLGFSQLATSFFATQGNSYTIRRRCFTVEYNIPADACANPMHGLIALPACAAGALALHV